ncbi:MAG: urate hydroxylase PuuD [Ectothiorhodospiraceae bacterium]|nr:urate hydroxylase PuuD [Ectothiorhodospiraceae bacterium]MCH8505079.1 urate hydroxylase PuuD [Ectothiorhodospiraceae bacterium]
MEAHLHEWANLLLRWAHFIVGVAWIGASFYFNWLENHIERLNKREGIAGDLWAIHGGGFYFVQKYAVAPEKLPSTLHWFKWEAYSTWITGFLLLIVVYYMNAGSMMVDPSVADIGQGTAIAIGLAVLIGSWFVYDGLCRSPLASRPVWLAATGFALLVLLAWGLSELFSGRAAYIHVGAAIGTCMVGNVFRVIIPSQRDMVDAMTAGREPDPAKGKNALLRSRHNNYLTLPVLFIMISHHFPSTYAHPWNWAVLAAVMLIGAGVRHYFNIRHLPERKVWILPAAAVATAAVIVATSPQVQDWRAGPQEEGESVSWAQVQSIIDNRCVSCHAASPTQAGFSSPPGGLRLDSDALIETHRDAINRTSVQSTYMPPGNLTGMTDEERAMLRQWIRHGATDD